MKYKLLILLLLSSICLISSCSKDDPIIDSNDIENQGGQNDPNENNNEDNDQDEVIENGTVSNPLVGNWYEVSFIGTHHLFIFNEDGTYEQWYKSDETSRETKGSYAYTNTHLTLTQDDGKTTEYEILKLTKTEFNFYVAGGRGVSYDLQASTLTSLEAGSKPSTIESGITLRFYYGNNGGVHFKIIPHFGIDYYCYALGNSVDENSDYKKFGAYEVSYEDEELEFGTNYNFAVVAYDKQGMKYKPVNYKFTTKGYKGMVNYFVYDGDYYELNAVEMIQDHGMIGSTQPNCKFLKMYNSDENYIRFEYTVPRWEGISKEWYEGNYLIQENAEYYTYSATLVIDDKVQHNIGSGTLVIKSPTSNYFTFDFELVHVGGHFEGSIME